MATCVRVFRAPQTHDQGPPAHSAGAAVQRRVSRPRGRVGWRCASSRDLGLVGCRGAPSRPQWGRHSSRAQDLLQRGGMVLGQLATARHGVVQRLGARRPRLQGALELGSGRLAGIGGDGGGVGRRGQARAHEQRLGGVVCERSARRRAHSAARCRRRRRRSRPSRDGGRRCGRRRCGQRRCCRRRQRFRQRGRGLPGQSSCSRSEAFSRRAAGQSSRGPGERVGAPAMLL